MNKFWTIGVGLGVLLAGIAAYAGATFLAEPKVQEAAQNDDRPAGLDAADIAQITPHKALYKIEMVQKRSSAQVANISGDMYFEWKPACDAWTTDHRFNLVYDYPDSPQLKITSDFTTYERYAGDTFDFNSRRRRDDEQYEELRGEATMFGHGGKADYTMPDDLEFELPKGTLYPMAHTVAVLKAAHDGKKFLKETIFDGSDDEGPAEVTAYIGKTVDAMALVTPSAAIDSSLINTPARRVRLAFFPLSSNDPSADYEMDLVLHDNGVISDMYVEYKDFSVTQKLVGLEKVTGQNCTENQGPKTK